MICRSCRKRVPEVDPGEVSICVLCGDIAVATEKGLRAPTASERARVKASSEYSMAMAVLADFDNPLLE